MVPSLVSMNFWISVKNSDCYCSMIHQHGMNYVSAFGGAGRRVGLGLGAGLAVCR